MNLSDNYTRHLLLMSNCRKQLTERRDSFWGRTLLQNNATFELFYTPLYYYNNKPWHLNYQCEFCKQH